VSRLAFAGAVTAGFTALAIPLDERTGAKLLNGSDLGK
jgi:hypothetical protein